MYDAEENDDDDADSDFELGGEVKPQGAPLLQGYLLVAKLYGHDGLEVAPPEDIEWDARWVELHADGTIWHADFGPGEVPEDEENQLGRLKLADVLRDGYSKGGTSIICLSQKDKCHLLRADDQDEPSEAADVREWHDAIAKLRA